MATKLVHRPVFGARKSRPARRLAAKLCATFYTGSSFTASSRRTPVLCFFGRDGLNLLAPGKRDPSDSTSTSSSLPGGEREVMAVKEAVTKLENGRSGPEVASYNFTVKVGPDGCEERLQCPQNECRERNVGSLVLLLLLQYRKSCRRRTNLSPVLVRTDFD